MDKHISSHPLSWPAGWPRAGQRVRARFGRVSHSQWKQQVRLEVFDGVQRVLGELQRLGVDRGDIIVSTNVPSRLDGLPRSGTAEPKDPGAAVYWRQVRNQTPRVMAIDLYDRVADNLAAIAATLEAMRAIERHGGAQILDRAFTGFTALLSPERHAHENWREILDVPADLDSEGQLKQLEMRYRAMRKNAHPDHGGSADKFSRVQAAYEQGCRELGYE